MFDQNHPCNSFKVALSFPIYKFLKKDNYTSNIKESAYIYIMTNASNEGICVEF